MGQKALGIVKVADAVIDAGNGKDSGSQGVAQGGEFRLSGNRIGKVKTVVGRGPQRVRQILAAEDFHGTARRAGQIVARGKGRT